MLERVREEIQEHLDTSI